MSIETVSVIIPAYKPDEKLLHTLNELVRTGFTDILVVDDGSGAAFEAVFEKVKAIPQCTLLRHGVNRGKGAALKTAFAYFLDNRPDGAGVVTADADGQHLAGDIAAASERMLSGGHIVLGVRDFSGAHVPSRSRRGNRITIAVFRLFFGMKISDTQTGLRAFPRSVMAEIAQAKGERYEFETQMLFLMSQRKIPFDEVPIYSLILGYLLSSVAAAVVDALAFFLFKSVHFLGVLPIPLTWSAAILARIISSLTNFLINAKLVFHGKADKGTLARYYILAVVQITVSTALVYFAEHLFSVTAPWLSTLIKAAVDTVLFFLSFRIQHKWVFNH